MLGAFAIYFVWITLAVSWNLAGGFGGLLNLGLAAFFGLGAVAAGVALQSGIPLVAMAPVSALAGVALALFLVPFFRLKSFYFAMATFVVPFMVKPIVEVTSGSAVFRVPGNELLTSSQLYYWGLGMTAFAFVGVYVLLRSKVGLAVRTIGSDELASAAIGVNTTLYKAAALAASGALAALAGMYYLEVVGTVDTTLFQGLTFSLLPLFMVIIGGTGTLEGPVLGALIYCALNYFVTSQFPGSTIDVFVLSLTLIAVAAFRPQGLIPRRARL